MIVPTPFFSHRGTHIRILEEAIALENRGHSVTIATYHIGDDIHRYLKTTIDVRRIMRLLFWYTKKEAGPDWQKIILNLLLIRKSFFLARTQKPDIIHAHLHEGVLIGWLIQKFLFWRKMKLVSDFHGSLVSEMVSHHYLKTGAVRALFTFSEKIINRMGDSAFASSPENAEFLALYRKETVRVIADGVNRNHYDNLPKKEDLRKKFGLPQGKVVVVYSGALMPDKGIVNLCSAIVIARDRNPMLHFFLAGFPKEHAQRLISERHIEKVTTLLSPLNYFELPVVNAAADIAVDPKDAQTLQASGKILQYMAAGLPIVCHDRPTNRNYIGDCAIYVAEVSGYLLAEGILAFANNSEKRKQCGRNNYERVKMFSWERTAEKIEEVYRSLGRYH